MPFRESSPMEERIALFRECETGAFPVTELCASVRTVSHTGSRREAMRPRVVRTRRTDHWLSTSSRYGVFFRTSVRRRSRHGSSRRSLSLTGLRSRRSATSRSVRAWLSHVGVVVEPSRRAR